MTYDPGALNAHYDQLERRFEPIDAPDYATLVVPNGNHQLPVHRWFHLKEAYSSGLVERVLKDTSLLAQSSLRVLDPYAGVGTTLVSAAELVQSGAFRSASAYGSEANGFLHLVASTKLECLQRPPKSFRKFAEKIRTSVLRSREPAPSPPTLSTFNTPAYFDRSDVDQLMRMKRAIDAAESGGAAGLDVALARLSLGGIIESVSNLRRDGRALRFTEKRSRPSVVDAFMKKVAEVVADLPDRGVRIGGRVVRDDGRLLRFVDRRFQRMDLVMYSPPYPNNIDYTEVYKLENWLLGYVNDATSFAQQRLRTVYSHPSILRPDSLPSRLLTDTENAAIQRISEHLHAATPDDRYQIGRRAMINGYLLDMYLTLRASRERVREGGWIVYVVGNSVHGVAPSHLVIAADLLIAELATLAGLEVDRLAVARHLRRRFVDSPRLRESVVFLRRGDGA